MRKSLSAFVIAATCAAGASQAQTITLTDQTYTLPVNNATFDFTVGPSPATFTEGTAIFNSADQGIGFLSGPGGYLQIFALTNGTTATDEFKSFNLTTPGSYAFSFDFANQFGTSGDQIALAATVTSVPEPGTIAMLLTGLLALGVALRHRVRKSGARFGLLPA